MRLLLDEMYPAPVAEGLGRRGIDALAVQATSMRGLPDAEIFIAAQLDQRCLVTENVRDFILLEAAWRHEQAAPHYGLVVVAPGVFPRHDRKVVVWLVEALSGLVTERRCEPGSIAWLETG